MKTQDIISPTVHKLFEALNVFQLDTTLQPLKPHFGSHIQLTDFVFNKEHLISRLVKTIIDWVFTKKRAQEIFNQEYGADCDLSSAATALHHAAKETFRISAPQGQFGELLLNAFLQHLFGAVPLLRKQSVRTSDNHERFGADAIHYSNLAGENIYLGESKCYRSSYQFPSAFELSLTSMNMTLNNFSKEIKKFSLGGFIEDDLSTVADMVLRNKLHGVTLNPISIIIYNETAKRSGNTPEECLSEIKKAILDQCKKIKETAYDQIAKNALGRMTYIIMPVWDLEALLDEFVLAL